MPNYDDRRYNAEMARREADGIIKRHGLNPNTMPHVQGLMDLADKFDGINEREEMRQGDYERENPRRTSTRDIPRYDYDDERMDYDDMEMRRRRDKRGRYMETTQPQITNIYPSYPGHIPPYMPLYLRDDGTQPTGNYTRMDPHIPPMYVHETGQPRQEGKMGFATGTSSRKNEYGQKSEKSSLKEKFDELEEYYMDYEKHKKAFESNQDPTEKQHMLMELDEFASYLEQIMSNIMRESKTPEEKTKLQQAAQKIMQAK